MNKNQSLWQASAEQFAAHDMQLYLDTHPNDAKAKEMYNNYRKNYSISKKRYEDSFGPITADSSPDASWDWIKNPWPWEMEAN